MENDVYDQYSVNFNVYINSVAGNNGHLSLNQSTNAFKVDVVEMAELIIEVRSFMTELSKKYAEKVQ